MKSTWLNKYIVDAFKAGAFIKKIVMLSSKWPAKKACMLKSFKIFMSKSILTRVLMLYFSEGCCIKYEREKTP